MASRFSLKQTLGTALMAEQAQSVTRSRGKAQGAKDWMEGTTVSRLIDCSGADQVRAANKLPRRKRSSH
jgi:hypothetical protein